MPTIHQLPSDVVLQIAAGEVVERPSSVVKELIENAIDAEARTIRITLKAGGQELIAVSDDGIGMEPEDARLAFERHATSKLYRPEDLERIGTLGFRGEALPSIGAVAHVRLVTALAGSRAGMELFVEEGRIRQEKETGCPAGTTVEVGELFYNTPARRKFLRAPSTELAKIQEVITQHALANPTIAFYVIHQRRTLLEAPAASTLRERLLQLFGADWAPDLVPVDGHGHGVRVEGLVSAPPRSWPHRRFQFWTVNRRPIRSQLLQHALYESYLSLLRRGQHPAACLQLTLDPSKVDANIHPSKQELRFAQPQQIHDLVRDMIAELIGVSTPVVNRWGGPSEPTVDRPIDDRAAAPAPPHGREFVVSEPAAGYRPTAGEQPAGLPGGLLSESVIEPLGQIHHTYIVAMVDGLLEIVDQHALHERLLFEQLMTELTASDRAIATQPRLVPHTLKLPMETVTVLADHQPLLARAGLDCEPFGRDAIVVRGTPALMSEAQLEPFLADLAESLLESGAPGGGEPASVRGDGSVTRLLQTVAATMACHAAIKANQPVGLRQMTQLLRDMHLHPLPPTCPHGRPLRVTFDKAQIERLFHRR